jgi:uncharacterized protein (DUF1800 family)
MRFFNATASLALLAALSLPAQTPADPSGAPHVIVSAPITEPADDTVIPTHKSAAPLKLPQSKIPPAKPLSQRERAVQLLNRFTYGPRPGDVERVLAQGPEKWFEQQLTPATINDAASNRRLNDFPTLRLTPEQTLAIFPDRGTIESVLAGRKPYPTDDPLLQSVYEVQVSKLVAEQNRTKHFDRPEPTDAEKATARKVDQATAARIAGELFALPKNQRLAALSAVPVADRIAFANNAPNDQRNTLFADMTPREREAIYAMQGGVGSQYRAYDELAQARVVRSILSERQLEQVMTDFWFNHFNIFFNKDSDQWYTTAYERDVIRPHALGKFRDLLLATAESPAMMVYLDNLQSIGPHSLANGVNPVNPNSKPGNRGLNENYGREVMELHTVGVNGGYTQADVTHLASILTGWGVDRPYQGGPFLYDPKKHEPGTKNWFGYTIDEQGKILAGPPANPAVAQAIAAANVPDGMKQGLTALTLLAANPRTAHFISYQLAQRFVADTPPPALVDRMTATFLASDGDIKAVLRVMVQSPDFNSHRYFRNKVKMPDEFVASAFRATATDPTNPGALVGLLAGPLGQPIYKALPPTGYYITADVWMNTQALLARLNFSDQLTHNRFANQKFDASRVLALSLMSDHDPSNAALDMPAPRPRIIPTSYAVSAPVSTGPDVALHVLEGSLIGGEISATTDRFIHSQMAAQPASNPTDTLNLLTALLLGSPEFQLH